jgi:hypothetical protein
MVYVEIILWTASMECVAKPVVERLDPHGNIFDHLIYRDRRWYKESGYTKDLRKLGRSMDRVIIMENSPLSVTLNRRNAILVKDFVGGYTNQNDQELVTSKDLLISWIDEVKAHVEKILVHQLGAGGNHVNTSHSSSTVSSCGLSVGSSPSSPTDSSSTPQPPPQDSTPSSKGPNPRNNFLTPLKRGEEDSAEVAQQYLTAGPTLPDFLHQHPSITHGNEIISRPRQQQVQARNAAVTGIVGARATTNSPGRRGIPGLTTSPYGASRRPLMYSR